VNVMSLWSLRVPSIVTYPYFAGDGGGADTHCLDRDRFIAVRSKTLQELEAGGYCSDALRAQHDGHEMSEPSATNERRSRRTTSRWLMALPLIAFAVLARDPSGSGWATGDSLAAFHSALIGSSGRQQTALPALDVASSITVCRCPGSDPSVFKGKGPASSNVWAIRGAVTVSR